MEMKLEAELPSFLGETENRVIPEYVNVIPSN